MLFYFFNPNQSLSPFGFADLFEQVGRAEVIRSSLQSMNFNANNPKLVIRTFLLRHPELDSGSPRGLSTYTVRRLRVKPAMTRGNISNEPFGIMKKNGKKQDFFSKISNSRARVRII